MFSLARLDDVELCRGPRIIPSGPAISQTLGHGVYRNYNRTPAAPLSPLDRTGQLIVANDITEVTKRTHEALRMGASRIKINSGGGVASAFDPLDTTQVFSLKVEAAVAAAADWNTDVAPHVFTDRAAQHAIRAGVKSTEHGHLLTDETLTLMRDMDIYLSKQPFLDDEDPGDDPADSANRRKFLMAAQGTDPVYARAREIGGKIVFGTDIPLDPDLPAIQGKTLANLGRWLPPIEAMRQVTSTAGELLALSGPHGSYPDRPLGGSLPEPMPI